MPGAVTEQWTCPDCGRSFANANQSHACVTLTLNDVLLDATPLAVELYRAVESALRDCGDYRIHPQKTRIAFITTMSFAGVRLANRWIDLDFITASPIDDERIRRVVLYGPTSFGNTVRISAQEDIDDALRGWLGLAYRRGLQETLDPKAEVEPVAGGTLDRLRVPVVATAVEEGEDLVLRIPRYATEAFAAHPAVNIRVRGSSMRGAVEHGHVSADLKSLGLVAGDSVDVTLTPAP